MNRTPVSPEYLAQTRVPSIQALCICMIFLPTVALALRFWSRIVVTKKVFWWDDWAILATLILSNVFLSINLWWTNIGLGRHYQTISRQLITPNSLTIHVALIFYQTVITMVKVSALLLYARLFQAKRSFRRTIWVLTAIVVAWWVPLLVVPYGACHPAKKVLFPLTPGTCSKRVEWLKATALINFMLDLIVLLVPMPIVWKLQMSFKRKMLLAFIFVLGYCSAFLSLARFIVIIRKPTILDPVSNPDISYNLIPLLELSMLEGPFAIIALCGPTINQLYHRFTTLGFSSLFSSRHHLEPSSPSDQSEKHADESSHSFDSDRDSRNKTGARAFMYKIRTASLASLGHPKRRVSNEPPLPSDLCAGVPSGTSIIGLDPSTADIERIPTGSVMVQKSFLVESQEGREV